MFLHREAQIPKGKVVSLGASCRRHQRLAIRVRVGHGIQSGRGEMKALPRLAPVGREETRGKLRGGKAERGEGQSAAGPEARGAGSDATERAKAGEQLSVNICVGFKKT